MVRKKIIFVLSVMVITTIILAMTLTNRIGMSAQKYKRVYTLYQIQYGDTAYGLASDKKYPGMDSRDYIRELNEANSGINLFKEPLYYGSYLLLITYGPK